MEYFFAFCYHAPAFFTPGVSGFLCIHCREINVLFNYNIELEFIDHNNYYHNHDTRKVKKIF